MVYLTCKHQWLARFNSVSQAVLSSVSVLSRRLERVGHRDSQRFEIKISPPKMTLGAPADYDRLKELQEFDDSKLGVRGLVESGATAIPRFFIHPPENLTSLRRPPTTLALPTVDLSDLNTGCRSAIVRQIADAARNWGFFQLINHGIPLSVIDAAISAVRSFHEQPAAIRSTYYSRGLGKDVTYNTNYDLFESKAASWRDSLYVLFAPGPPDVEKRIPEICRRELVAWDESVRRVGEVLGEILSEGLGLERGRLKQTTGLEGRAVVAHYYPYCPEPDRTLGNVAHTDPGVVTVLAQNEIGGLEVKHGEEWVAVAPPRGALVVNVGDLLRVSGTAGVSTLNRLMMHARGHVDFLGLLICFMVFELEMHGFLHRDPQVS